MDIGWGLKGTWIWGLNTGNFGGVRNIWDMEYGYCMYCTAMLNKDVAEDIYVNAHSPILSYPKLPISLHEDPSSSVSRYWSFALMSR